MHIVCVSILYVYVCGRVHYDTGVEVRGQFVGVSSLLPLCGSRGWNSGLVASSFTHRATLPVPFPLLRAGFISSGILYIGAIFLLLEIPV